MGAAEIKSRDKVGRKSFKVYSRLRQCSYFIAFRGQLLCVKAALQWEKSNTLEQMPLPAVAGF